MEPVWPAVRRGDQQIFNAARIYNLGLQRVQIMPDFPEYSEDKIAQLAKAHKEAGGQPSHKRYGYVLT